MVVSKLVCINFCYTLIMHNDFKLYVYYILMSCNFTCKYVLTSRILHLVHILLIWLLKCIGRGPVSAETCWSNTDLIEWCE